MIFYCLLCDKDPCGDFLIRLLLWNKLFCITFQYQYHKDDRDIDSLIIFRNWFIDYYPVVLITEIALVWLNSDSPGEHKYYSISGHMEYRSWITSMC